MSLFREVSEKPVTTKTLLEILKEALQRSGPESFINSCRDKILLIDACDLVVINCSSFSVSAARNLEDYSLAGSTDDKDVLYMLNELNLPEFADDTWEAIELLGADYRIL